MSNPEHFRRRATAYRQLAQESLNEEIAGDMFEIAKMFNSMADDLTLLWQTPEKHQPRVSWISEIFAGMHLERPRPLGNLSQP